jgi:four helix bundle protein
MARPNDLKDRSKAFALRALKLVESLPNSTTARTIGGGQLARCATSVAANYRAACRGRSTAEFLAKMGIVEEETDESAFWIEMLIESSVVRRELVADLLDEADQLTAIWVASINTARKGKR